MTFINEKKTQTNIKTYPNTFTGKCMVLFFEEVLVQFWFCNRFGANG